MIDNGTADPPRTARAARHVGVLGDRDRLDVVPALRRLADIDTAQRRHPWDGRRPS